jgi:hypothetical protein
MPWENPMSAQRRQGKLLAWLWKSSTISKPLIRLNHLGLDEVFADHTRHQSQNNQQREIDRAESDTNAIPPTEFLRNNKPTTSRRAREGRWVR